MRSRLQTCHPITRVRGGRARRVLLGAALGSAYTASTLLVGAAESVPQVPSDPPISARPALAGSPATRRPLSLALAVPDWGRMALSRTVPGVLEGKSKEPMSPFTAPALTAKGLLPFAPSGFSDQLFGRMSSEAGRFQKEGRRSGWSELAPADSAAEEERAILAETIITRSFKRTIDRRLEALAAATPGLGAALEWAQSLGASRRTDAAPPIAGAGGTPRASGSDPWSSSIRLRIDAHPKI